MADASITAANVKKAVTTNGLPGSMTETGNLLGATGTAGQPIIRDSSDSYKMKLAQATSVTLAACYGILLGGGAADQPVEIVRSGLYNPGFTVVVGMLYCVSATAGAICPYSDLVSTNYVCFLGIGYTSSLILLDISYAKIAKP